MARTTQASVLRSRFDLADLAREIAEELKAGASCDVEFIAPLSLEVEGDPTLLRLALENLLRNAWKFSSKTAAPKVELGVELSQGRRPVYYVKDNGAGFDAIAAQKLFGLFQRFHHQDEFPGAGVGLASVQWIIRKHEGKIWADSAPGEGATFYFTLAAD
jgi:signal transduction histidine kinase